MVDWGVAEILELLLVMTKLGRIQQKCRVSVTGFIQLYMA